MRYMKKIRLPAVLLYTLLISLVVLMAVPRDSEDSFSALLISFLLSLPLAGIVGLGIELINVWADDYVERHDK